MNEQTQKKKRIILILGGKGGTGKTLFCRTLYYFLIQAGKNCLAYDADIENPEFAEYHNQCPYPVHLLNFLDVAKAKQFFTTLEEKQPEVVLVDMPGASGQATRSQLEQFGAFDLAADLNYRMTIATVFNNGYNPINSLDLMLEFCQGQADYVVIKSQFWNQGSLNFDRWDQSETRQHFSEFQGVEIELPILEISTFDEMHERCLSFFTAQELPFGDRILVNSYLNRSRPQIERAGCYLGVSEASPIRATLESTKTKAKRTTGRKKAASQAEEAIAGNSTNESAVSA